jgi:conjugal transfer pilus assembly protein TraB
MNFWEKLSPSHKRYLIIGAAIGILALVVVVFGPDDQPRNRNQQQKVIKSVLTDSDTRSASIDAIAGDLANLRRDRELQQRDLDKLREELDRAKKEQENTTAMKRELDSLRVQLEQLAKERLAATADGKAASTGGKKKDDDKPMPSEPKEVFKEAPLPKQEPQDRGKAGNRDAQKSFVIREVSADQSTTAGAEKDPAAGTLHIPSGSMISGVLQTGIDAPTGMQASRNPIPVLLRVKAEAVLPNQYRADVKECLAVLSGYGDLSSERAYLRGETISCVRNDGSVIEAKLEGSAIGEDGKAGLRGRLVSKQGQLVARAALAGFFQGASDAFGVNPVPVISTTSTGQRQYDDVMSDQALKGAGLKGAGTALGKVADFYMKLADAIFPVIEVDGMRTVDIMLTGPLKIKTPAATTNSTDDFSYGRN